VRAAAAAAAVREAPAPVFTVFILLAAVVVLVCLVKGLTAQHRRATITAAAAGLVATQVATALVSH
jgi:hypothetical protein